MSVIFKILKWGCIICLFVSLISFTSVSFKKDIFSIAKISIDSTSQNFITYDIIEEYLRKDFSFHYDSISFDFQQIELALNNNPFIKNAQTFLDLNEGVSINIEAREPLSRIVTYDTSYYITDDCSYMPCSNNYTARVLIINGDVNSMPFYDLCELSKYISSNEFWKSLISQVNINYNSEIILIPRVGDNEIFFGDINNIDMKFKKLLIFYTKIIPKKGWACYNKINLAFEDQIICTKI